MSLVEVEMTEASVAIPCQERKEMISVILVEGRTHVRINSSSLGVIQECPRKAQYSLNQRWRANTESPATLFGRAIHKALEVYYCGSPDERVLPKLEHLELIGFGHEPPHTNNDLIYRAVAAFVKEAAPLSPLPDTDKRSIQNGIWILHNYFRSYIDDPYVAYVDDLGPFVERTFTFRLYERDDLVIDIFGTIDFAFRHLISGVVIPGDHKTTSSLGWGGSSYYDRDKPNHQYTMYMLGARKIFGIESSDFMVNAIEVKAKPKTARGSASNFPRQITSRTEEDFDELRDVIIEAVGNYLRWSHTQTWPLGPIGACTAYGSCTYKQVCASPKSMRNNILQNKFTQE